jgi:hypothetical protein
MSEREDLTEESFIYLAAHPTVKSWKRKLYGLLAGESNELLSKLGIEQYVRVLLAESKDKFAEYCFTEALGEVIQNWTPTVWETADRLNRILSLIAAFTPAVGFSKVLTHLERTENVKRSEERVSDEHKPVDLYKLGLLALAQYYPTPPYHSYDDVGFAAYRALLERNLADQRYSGYAAIRLLELKVLDLKSSQFASLLLTSDDAANAVFEMLLDSADEPREAQSVGRRFGDLLLVCAEADNIQRFEYLANLNNATFDPYGDYQVFFPTLTLSDGKVLDIPVNIDEAKNGVLHQFVRYSPIKVQELFQEEMLSEDRINLYISGYIAEVIKQTEAMNELMDELKRLDAHIHTSGNNYVITVKRDNSPREIKLTLKPEIIGELMRWILKSKSPVTQFRFARAA